MRSVVYQNNNRFELPTNGTNTLSSGLIRSRTRSYEGGSLRGVAMSAVICDNTHIQFEVRPEGGAAQLANVEAFLTIRRFAIGGGWDGVDFLAAFPNPEDDVSGQLQNLLGNLVIDATDDAVYEARLRLVNRGAALKFQCLISVFAELLPVEVDLVKSKTGAW
jgi:hypothetical protein